jgi:hypothetical protein
LPAAPLTNSAARATAAAHIGRPASSLPKGWSEPPLP